MDLCYTMLISSFVFLLLRVFALLSHPDMKLVINQQSAYPLISSQINPADKRWGILADEQAPLPSTRLSCPLGIFLTVIQGSEEGRSSRQGKTILVTSFQ